jgi:tetratricopeptide (TPR) repeat protein
LSKASRATSVTRASKRVAHLLILGLAGAQASSCSSGEGGDADGGGAAEAPTVTTVLPPGAEAISLLGDPLYPPEQPEDVRAVYTERLQEAESALANAPEDVDSLIWMGRRTAYLGHYRDAIEIYTNALRLHPDDARLYRHRGHRYLTVRDLDRARADFERAASLVEGQPDQIEPDGLPNAINQPLSTLQFNIWYHLALAHYVEGHWEDALDAQRRCLEVSRNPDLLVATSYWLYMTLARMGRDEEAAEVLEPITSDMEIVENDAYYRLLLLFKGAATLEDVVGPAGDAATLQSTTTAYGVGVWHLLNERTAEAHATWEAIVAEVSQWPAFGYLAAEGELARSAAR